MTTVCYRDGTMAADSQETWDDLKCPARPKIVVIRQRLVGASGDVAAMQRLFEWLEKGGRKPRFPMALEAMVVTHDGHCDYLAPPDFTADRITLPFFAIGSGKHIAIGAMEMGASATQAVEVAIKWDAASGGPVMVKRIQEIMG